MRSRIWPQTSPHTQVTHSRWTPYRNRALRVHLSDVTPVEVDTKCLTVQQSWRGNYSVPTILTLRTVIPQQHVGILEVPLHPEAGLLPLADPKAGVEAEEEEEVEADLDHRTNLQAEVKEWI